MPTKMTAINEKREVFCHRCGAPAGRPVYGESYLCNACGRQADRVNCPTCGVEVEYYRIPTQQADADEAKKHFVEFATTTIERFADLLTRLEAVKR